MLVSMMVKVSVILKERRRGNSLALMLDFESEYLKAKALVNSSVDCPLKC